jgi:hypothetical protein
MTSTADESLGLSSSGDDSTGLEEFTENDTFPRNWLVVILDHSVAVPLVE